MRGCVMNMTTSFHHSTTVTSEKAAQPITQTNQLQRVQSVVTPPRTRRDPAGRRRLACQRTSSLDMSPASWSLPHTRPLTESESLHVVAGRNAESASDRGFEMTLGSFLTGRDGVCATSTHPFLWFVLFCSQPSAWMCPKNNFYKTPQFFFWQNKMGIFMFWKHWAASLSASGKRVWLFLFCC